MSDEEAAAAVIPHARAVQTRHESVPGPRVLEARGIPVVYGGAGSSGGTVDLRDELGGYMTGGIEHALIVGVQNVNGRGVLNRLCIPRESIEAFVDATRRDPGQHRIARATALMREAIEEYPEEFDGDAVVWLEQAISLAERCEDVEAPPA